MPDCGCSAEAAADKPGKQLERQLDKPVEPVTVARGQAAPVEQDPERLARVAMYALGGYFHSGCLGDMFVCTPDVWIERVGDRSGRPKD
jgi:hypothetical protein